jgi:5-methyltetrahydropteroyltriglutamate--homocysteine methyltransferase
MKTSVDRVLTTHVGSLPRGKEALAFLFAQDKGESYDEAQFEAAMRRGVADAVRNQVEAGLDILNDGETAKISYATYIKHRLNGF